MSNNTRQHTPLPWELDAHLVGQIINFDGSKLVARAGRVGPSYDVDPDQIERNANAAFIVKAVNSHDQLVTALRFYANQSNWSEFISDEQAAAFDRNVGSSFSSDNGEMARNALAAAGEQP